MVDLVKIRKKAKEKAAAAAGAVADAVAEVAAEVTGRGAEVAGHGPEAAGRGSQVAGADTKALAQSERAAASAPPSKRRQKSAESSARSVSPDATAAAAPAPQPVEPQTDNRQPSPDSRESRNRQLTSKLERFLETAGERRVERAQATQAAVGEQLELLTFSIAGELYAVSIDNVVEIVTPRSVTRIPNSDPLVVGILSLRGMIVTLIDARRRLGHPEAGEATADSRIIVVQLEHETLGFTVDKVLRVVKMGASAIEPHPVVHASEQDDSVRGVFRYADALTILLDLDKLLNTRSAASA